MESLSDARVGEGEEINYGGGRVKCHKEFSWKLKLVFVAMLKRLVR